MAACVYVSFRCLTSRPTNDMFRWDSRTSRSTIRSHRLFTYVGFWSLTSGSASLARRTRTNPRRAPREGPRRPPRGRPETKNNVIYARLSHQNKVTKNSPTTAISKNRPAKNNNMPAAIYVATRKSRVALLSTSLAATVEQNGCADPNVAPA